MRHCLRELLQQGSYRSLSTCNQCSCYPLIQEMLLLRSREYNSVQSIIAHVFGFLSLKLCGIVLLTCSLVGQIGIAVSRRYMKFIQLTKRRLTVHLSHPNDQPRCSVVKPLLSPIKGRRNWSSPLRPRLRLHPVSGEHLVLIPS